MKTKYLLNLFIFGAISLIIYIFFRDLFFVKSNYIQQIEVKRKQKQDFLQNSKDSPMKQFHPISYYPIDSQYIIKSKIYPLSNKDFFLAVFSMQNTIDSLIVEKKEGLFFIAFHDKTNGKETYGGGRFLEIPVNYSSNELVIDFNQAFFPYCAYNPAYICPAPPLQNYLSIKIKAGERF